MGERRERKARRVLWAGAAVFAAVQLGAAVGANRVWPQLGDPLYGDKYVRLARRWAAPGGAERVLALGTSRTANGLHAALLDAEVARAGGRPVAAFNFGIHGVGSLTNWLYLRRLLAAGERPGRVLVEVHAPFLVRPGAAGSGSPVFEPPPEMAARLRAEELRLYLRHRNRAEAPETWDRWLTGRLVPAYGQRFFLLGRLLPQFLPFHLRYNLARDADPSGWSAARPMYCTPERRAREAAAMHQHIRELMADFRPDGPGAAALAGVLAECRRAAIPVTLVLYPEASAYRSWQPPEARRRLDELLAHWRREYGATLIDARDWVADNDFVDTLHLGPAGAEAFTRRLARELVAGGGAAPAGQVSRCASFNSTGAAVRRAAVREPG